MQLIGHAGTGYFHAESGIFTPCSEQKNLTLYRAADILAGLLGGNSALAISHFYFHYQNTNGDVSITPSFDRSSSRADFAAITGASPNYEDYLRVPIVSDGKIFRYPSNTTNYQGNAIYFSANSVNSSNVGESPAHNAFGSSTAHGPSKIFSIALVSAPVPSDPTQDIVFARLNLTTPLVCLDNSYPGAYWTMRLL